MLPCFEQALGQEGHCEKSSVCSFSSISLSFSSVINALVFL